MAVQRPYSRFAQRDSLGGPSQSVTEADITRLNERTNSLSDDILSLSAAVTTKFAEVNSNFTSIASDLRQQISGLSQKFEERGRAPWTLLISFGSFLIVFLGVVGGLAYAPIQGTENRLSEAVARLADNAITQREFQTYRDNTASLAALIQATNNDRFNNFNNLVKETANGKTDKLESQQFRESFTDRLNRIGAAVTENQKLAVNIERYLSDQRAEDNRDQAVQRQIDQLRESVSNIYNPRDALSRLERKLDEDEALINAIRAAKDK